MRAVFRFVLLLCILQGCAGVGVREDASGTLYLRRKIVQNARDLLGRREIVFSGRRFNYDCSGFIKAVYYKSTGIDLFDGGLPNKDLRGVEMIHKYCRAYGKLYAGRVPEEGDIIFFHDTYDADRDGRLKDRCTHAGIVERVDDHKTITFIHLDSAGIVRDKMNLRYPGEARSKKEGTIINTYLRKASGAYNRPGALSAQLFESFGTIF